MKSLLAVLALLFCFAGCTRDEFLDITVLDDLFDDSSAEDEEIMSTSDAMKWTPPSPWWYPCRNGNVMCWCQGNVMDCRNAVPIP